MSKSKLIPIISSKNIQKNCELIGDKLYTQYIKTGDLKSAQLSLYAYNTAIKYAVVQLIRARLSKQN